MIEQCAWCGRLRVDLADIVHEGEPELGPMKGTAWLRPADDRKVAGPLLVSHGMCPTCAKGLGVPYVPEADLDKAADKPDLGAWPGHGAARLSPGGQTKTHTASDCQSEAIRKKRRVAAADKLGEVTDG